jgi:hypothetical protein
MSAAPSLCSLAALTDEATLSPLVELTLDIGSEGGSNPLHPSGPGPATTPRGAGRRW